MNTSAESRRLEPDEPLPALAEMIGALFEEIVENDDELRASLVGVTVDLPVEVDVTPADDAADGVATVRMSPPTLYTETSVMPVLHRLVVRLEQHDGG